MNPKRKYIEPSNSSEQSSELVWLSNEELRSSGCLISLEQSIENDGKDFPVRSMWKLESSNFLIRSDMLLKASNGLAFAQKNQIDQEKLDRAEEILINRILASQGNEI